MQLARFCPSQAPAQGGPSTSHAVRVPWGAPATAVQVPTALATSHASHCPLHAVLQHTWSAQWPEPHCESPAHAAPALSFATHTPAEQKKLVLGEQSPSLLQLPAHPLCAPAQRNGAHVCVCAVGQEPPPVQVAASVARPLLHAAERQLVVAPG